MPSHLHVISPFLNICSALVLLWPSACSSARGFGAALHMCGGSTSPNNRMNTVSTMHADVTRACSSGGLTFNKREEQRQLRCTGAMKYRRDCCAAGEVSQQTQCRLRPAMQSPGPVRMFRTAPCEAERRVNVRYLPHLRTTLRGRTGQIASVMLNKQTLITRTKLS